VANGSDRVVTSRVAVIGGGIAGLAAAHRLVTLDPAVDVEVHEASERVGGNIKTSPFAGRPIDEAADAFLTRVPWALELCAEVGIADQLVHPSGLPAGIYASGAIHDLPSPHVMGVPVDPVALARSPLVGDDAVAALIADVEARSPVVDPADSLGVLLRARLGDELTERIVEPLLHGVYAAPVDQLSLATVTPQFAAAARASSFTRALADAVAAQPEAATPIFATPRGGMQELTDALARRLGPRIRLASPVQQLTVAGSGVEVVGAAGTSVFDAVIIATPAHVTAGLLGASPAAAAFALDPVSVAFITLAFDPDTIGVPLDRSGFLVPAAGGQTVTACSWTSVKWPHLAEGPVVVRAAVGRADDDAIVAADDQTIRTTVVDDLREMMHIAGSPEEVRISRWPKSFPRYRPGHLDRLAAATADLAGTRIAVAGAATSGIGIPTCIQGADVAARRIAAML
jgi:oxygen-dependent protoporphyrinogen oxidase